MASEAAPLLTESALGGMASAKTKVVVGPLLLMGLLTLAAAVVAPPQSVAPQAVSLAAANTLKPSEPEKQRSTRLDRFGDALPEGAVARIGTVRWWCGDSDGSLVYAPDGKSLVFRDFRGTVHILDATTGKELRRIHIPDDKEGCCFTVGPNGKIVATAALNSPMVRMWDMTTGKKLRQFEVGKHGSEAVAFSPDGKTLVAGAYRSGMRVRDTTTGKEINRIAGKDNAYVNGIFCLPDGKTLISGDGASISWWDIATGREIRQIDGEKYGKGSSFHYLAVSKDGKRIAAIFNSRSKVLLVWDGATGNEIRRIELGPQFAGLACLCFSPDGRTLACGNRVAHWGNQTVFFAAATGEELRRWDEGNDSTMQLAFSPDGKILAQAKSNVIRLREAVTGKPIVPDLGLPYACMAVRFSRDGKSLIAGCHGGRTGIWNPLTGEPLTPVRDPPECFGRKSDTSLGPALTPQGERVALANLEGVLHVWEQATGKECCRIGEPKIGWGQADFSPDGTWLTVEHQDNIIRLWDARTGKLLCSFPHIEREHPFLPHSFSADGRILAIARDFRDHGIVHLYETATGKEQGRLVWRDNTGIGCLLFTPDDNYLLAAHGRRPQLEDEQPERADQENGLRLWHWKSGREVRRFPAPGGAIRSMVISPDGKTVAAAVYDTILLWELASGAERGRFAGHREWIWSLAFSPDGRLLASGSLDHTACVWDVTGICPDGLWTARRVPQDELQRLWADLGSKDGVRAYRAVWQFAAADPSTVAFLTQRLQPAPAVAQERMTRLIADLDSDRFETREHASAELQQLGEQAESALRKALTAKPTLEASRRLRVLLDRVESRSLSAEQLHHLRAVEVLEHIRSSEARHLLRTLAEGAPEAMLTREAKAALERLLHPSEKSSP